MYNLFVKKNLYIYNIPPFLQTNKNGTIFIRGIQKTVTLLSYEVNLTILEKNVFTFFTLVKNLSKKESTKFFWLWAKNMIKKSFMSW